MEGQAKIMEIIPPTLPAWQEAAERSTIRRMNWESILGKSLSKFVAEKIAEKQSQEAIEAIIMQKAIEDGKFYERGFSYDEVRKKVRIGVSARIAEMATEKTAYRTRNIENGVFRACVHQFKTGSRAIFIPTEVKLEPGTVVQLTARKVIVATNKLEEEKVI